MDYNMFNGGGALYGGESQKEGLVPWLIRTITQGNPDLYKKQFGEMDAARKAQEVQASPIPPPAPAPAAATAAAVAPPSPMAPPAPALTQAMDPTGASYDDPDTARALQQVAIENQMAEQGGVPGQGQGVPPGILSQILGDPRAAAMIGQMGAGMLRGKDLKDGLANAFGASADFAQKQQAVKRTPIANGTAILEEYADGTSKVVPVTAGAKPKAPTGYQWTSDGRLEAIPGGPRDLKAIELSKSLENNFTRLDAKNDNVTKAIDKALGQVGTFSAGPIGQATSWIGGTPAADLEGTLDEIQANIGFAELEDMRKSSPTGGALGQVAVRELEFLQAVKGSLKQKQTPAQLRANLERIKEDFIASRQRLRDAYEADIARGLIQRGSQPSLEGGARGASAPAAPRGNSVQDRASGYLQ